MGLFESSYDFSVITIANSKVSDNAGKNIGKFVESIKKQELGIEKIQIIFACENDSNVLKCVKKLKKEYPKNIKIVKTDKSGFAAYDEALKKANGKFVTFTEISATYSNNAFKSVKKVFSKNDCAIVKLPVYVKKDKKSACFDRAYLTKRKIAEFEDNFRYATLDLNSCFLLRKKLDSVSNPDFFLKLQLKEGKIGINSKAKYYRHCENGTEISKFIKLENLLHLTEEKDKKGQAALSAMAKFAYENGIKSVSGEDAQKLNEQIEKLYKDHEYEYKISVVIPVYKVEKYVEETFASIRRQNIGFFENIQVVFVDDGSPDRSGEICDEIAKKYPENVLCIHKENGGVSSARNTGIEYAKGKYIGFCDPDDYYKYKATFSSVCELFEDNYDDIDVVSIPIRFFEGKHGPHPLNNKFANGTRVIDLNSEPWTLQISMATAFAKAETIKDFRFNTSLRISEDGDLALRVLAEKMKLGVCAGMPYMYRTRTDNSSALQNNMKKLDYFEECVTGYMFGILEYYKNKVGYIPNFVKCALAYEIQWRVTYPHKLTTTILNDEQAASYVENIKKVLSYIDDDLIINNPYANFERKYKMLEIKGTLNAKTELVWYHPYGYRYAVTSNGNALGYHSSIATKIHLFEIRDNVLSIEGESGLIRNDFKNVSVFLRIGNTDYPAQMLPHLNRNINAWGEPILQFYPFKSSISLTDKEMPIVISVVMKCDDLEIVKLNLAHQKMSPINTKVRYQHYIKDGYLAIAGTSIIRIEKCDISKENSLEKLYQNAISQVKRFEEDEISEMISLRNDYFRLKPTLKKPIWLISDRVDKADDNGEAFFKYLIENHKDDVDAYFVLNKDSVDFERLNKIGPTVETFSYEHKLLSLLADKIISSSANENTLDPFHPYRYIFADIYRAEFIFLQHGLIKDDLSGWLYKYSKNISGFVTSAIAEYNSIVNQKAYNYSEKEVWLTGLPRFDRLYHDERKLITFAPTWRKYLVKDTDFHTGLRPFNDEIYSSDYLKFYTSLLNSEKLISAAEKCGYTLQFIPHPQMISLMPAFNFSDKIKIIDATSSYRDMFAQSDLLITDYSSVVFDFVYLRKPIVYTQFDKDTFFGGGHSYEKGYFDYERDGFGEVEYDLDSTIDRIIEYMKNGCKLKDKYRERIDNFFAFNDKGACERIYNKIIEMDK